MIINYVTTNIDKFNKAKFYFDQLKLKLIQKPIELEEIQSFSGEEIVERKAKLAYQSLNQPILVSDDSWSIPALNGFPGVNMKQCNHYLKSEDWLRLMSGIKDRRIFLTSYLAFFDGKKMVVSFYKEEAYFLQEVRGQHLKAPHLCVIAYKDETKSVAEYLDSGVENKDQLSIFWQNFIDKVVAP